MKYSKVALTHCQTEVCGLWMGKGQES